MYEKVKPIRFMKTAKKIIAQAMIPKIARSYPSSFAQRILPDSVDIVAQNLIPRKRRYRLQPPRLSKFLKQTFQLNLNRNPVTTQKPNQNPPELLHRPARHCVHANP
jgi:hypothetical protein